MSRYFKKGVLVLLVLCLLQSVFVPSVTTAASTQPVTYDFVTQYKNYSYLFHWKTQEALGSQKKVPDGLLDSNYASGKTNWTLAAYNGYTSINGSRGYLSIMMGKTCTVFKIKSPGTGNYEVTVNYTVTNSTSANTGVEYMIIPAEKSSYTYDEVASLVAQNRAPLRVSCYDETASTYKNKNATMEYSFLEGQEYLFVVNNGNVTGTVASYLRGLSMKRIGDYNPPENEKYARPVTILEEALYRWEDDYSIVAEVNGYDYFALPIYGGKMYIFNLDTWQLIDEVNTGIDVPRGITADDNGVIYLGGTSYSLFTYDLKTNQTGTTTNFNKGNVSLGSLYDMTYGEDGNLYVGTDKGHVIQYNPITDTSTPVFLNDALASYGITDVGYVSSVIQQGQHIYAASTTNKSKHYLVKLNKDTFAVEGITDYTSTGVSTYMSHMSITSDGIILGPNRSLMAVDTETMKLLTPEEFGADAPVQCYASVEINGMHYYVSSKDRHLYRYDLNATGDEKITKMTNIGQFIDCQGRTVTFDKDEDGKLETYLLAIENPKQYDIKFINVETGAVWSRRIPLESDAGAGTGVNSLTNGPVGSNELYFGGFTSNQVMVYNTAEGKITSQIAASGIQTDAIYVDGNTIYGGNYTEAQLTRLHRDTNKPEVLMTLHNSLFNQSRIHSITGGDNKIFFGTFPYVYKHGGVIAWYDMTTNRSYVAVGPNPTDVYYANYEDTKYDYTAKNPTVPVSNVKWYNEVTGEQLTGFDEWKGIVDYQGVKEVAYHDGILYAATSISGGTNTSPVNGTSSVIFAYDVAERKIIATFDPASYGFLSPVPTISGIELDGNGNLWCVVSETLFTLTLNKSTGTFTYSEKLSFGKSSYDATQNRANSDILFKDGYVYVAFERVGSLCKVNVANPKDYTLLLPEVTSNGQVPESFVFGEDGNLYYLLGTSLNMLALNPTDEEWAVADAVTEQIASVTTDTLVATRQAYDALTMRQQSLVQNYNALLQAEANDLIQQINALGDITWNDYDRIQELLDVYKQMPRVQQKMVNNHYVLVNANQKLLMLEKDLPVVVTKSEEEVFYYATLEEAVANAENAIITLQDDVVADIVILRSGTTLDLSGYTLTANYLFAMNGATVLDGGAECTGGGLLKIEKANLALAENNGNGVIPVWNGVDGYIFTSVNFLQIAKQAGYGAAQYIFLPQFSNQEATALLADGGLDNGVQIKVSLNWNNGQSQQFYTYQDALVEKVFASGGRLVFSLTVTGIAEINDMVANAVVISDCGAQATVDSLPIEDFNAFEELNFEFGHMEIIGF